MRVQIDRRDRKVVNAPDEVDCDPENVPMKIGQFWAKFWSANAVNATVAEPERLSSDPVEEAMSVRLSVVPDDV
jgi:hypothetical protein